MWPRTSNWRVGPGRRDVVALFCLALAFYHGWGALMIEAKAALAPVLIKGAWQRTLAASQPGARPWPWADTWPVGWIQAPAHAVDFPVLAGDSGNALAFAPGQALQSAPLGSAGLAVVGGHRDTHFSFLRDLSVGDALRIQLIDGTWRDYRVVATSIVDSRRQGWSANAPDQTESLLLVTCYPFDALRPNGPLRYLVHAEPV